MQNKTYVIAVIIFALITAGGFLILAKNRGVGESSSQPSQSPIQEAKEAIVIHTDSGFSPSPLTIKVGDTVVFKNESSKTMWPASAFHPTHTEYPTKGGCIGSTFDACRALNPGESWPFKFDIKGVWKYHDHTDPTHFGQIVVE